jgi:S1-C subfamily serine protease
MASGLIIHITVGSEKRTEFFTEERIRIGSDDTNDLQIHTNSLNGRGMWLELENSDGVYRIIEFDPDLDLQVNEHRIRRFVAITDGDRIDIPNSDISFTFFSLAARSALITTNRENIPVAQFIEEAALEARTSPKRDDAKAFLREFTRELLREVSWTTKAIVFVLAAAFIYGLVYVGYSVSRELRQSRETTEQQSEIIKKLEQQLGQTSDQLGNLEKTNSDLLNTVSLGRNMRVAYGNGVCLIVGVYDLVDKKTGKVLRYPDQSARQSPYEPAPSEDSPAPNTPGQFALTTEGNGSPVEYDFIGTGFHVGAGYIVTNRHVVQPWSEDDAVMQMMRDSDGRATVKRLVAYFPNYPQPFQLRIKAYGNREDLAIGSIDPEDLPSDIPVLPLDNDSDAAAIGKTVVTMGYPSGPDRLLAMVDDDEAKSINQRFGNSRQNLINFLAQSRKILPLTTQGAITDLDARRIVHDAKTAEGGSGAPLFGQSGKVIGVNFGVFTENTAANMAVPIKFAIELLNKAGWKSPDQQTTAAGSTNSNANAAASRSQ